MFLTGQEPIFEIQGWREREQETSEHYHIDQQEVQACNISHLK